MIVHGMRLEDGDLVRLICDTGRVVYGVVEYASTGHVRVRWEDGQVGLLYPGPTAVATIMRLQLVERRRAGGE